MIVRGMGRNNRQVIPLTIIPLTPPALVEGMAEAVAMGAKNKAGF
jgi:hypothetical protein